MDIIKRDAAAKAGQPIDEARMAVGRKMLEDQIAKESDCYFATARLWDDGLIDPAETRNVLGLALSASLNAPPEETRFGVFRM